MQVVTVENLGDVFDVGVSVSGEIGLRNVVGATPMDAGGAGLVPAPAAGEDGKFLRGDGTWQAPATETYGEVALGSSFAITAANDTFVDTGLAITLPAAGVYLVVADVRGVVTGSAADHSASAALYDQGASAIIANSERLVAYSSVANVGFRGSACIHALVSVGASEVIRLYAKRNGGGGWISSVIVSNGDGRTALRYIKLA